MKVDVIKAWKNAEYRASLSQEELSAVEMPVMSEVDQSLLAGGTNNGTGWFSSISGDCYDDGTGHANCWNPLTLLESFVAADC